MRNILILLILVSIGLTTPALAKKSEGERQNKSSVHQRGVNTYQGHREYAKHDRGQKYDHFQKKMKKLRKNLRHERRDDRRQVRHDVRRARKIARYYDNHRPYRAPVVVAPRRSIGSLISPSLVLRIPLNW